MGKEKMSGNKGEWSELYVFLKLLSQGKVYAADEQMKRLENIYYPILRIIREEKKGDKDRKTANGSGEIFYKRDREKSEQVIGGNEKGKGKF